MTKITVNLEKFEKMKQKLEILEKLDKDRFYRFIEFCKDDASLKDEDRDKALKLTLAFSLAEEQDKRDKIDENKKSYLYDSSN